MPIEDCIIDPPNHSEDSSLDGLWLTEPRCCQKQEDQLFILHSLLNSVNNEDLMFFGFLTSHSPKFRAKFLMSSPDPHFHTSHSSRAPTISPGPEGLNRFFPGPAILLMDLRVRAKIGSQSWRTDLDQIWLRRLSETTGVATLFRGCRD